MGEGTGSSVGQDGGAFCVFSKGLLINCGLYQAAARPARLHEYKRSLPSGPSAVATQSCFVMRLGFANSTWNPSPLERGICIEKGWK